MANDRTEYNEEFFYKYYQGKSWCTGSRCNALCEKQCVMSPWRGDEENPSRDEILRGLAKLSVEINKKIAGVFASAKRDRDELPASAPIFVFDTYTCESYKRVSTDFGGPFD